LIREAFGGRIRRHYRLKLYPRVSRVIVLLLERFKTQPRPEARDSPRV
jgi:hypothetical protein